MESLLSMGFSQEQASSALHRCGGNIELALESLLSPTPTATPNTGFCSPNPYYGPSGSRETIIRLNISQFTFGELGTSACTAIASSVMKYLLEQLQSTGSGDTSQIFNKEALNEVIFSGVTKYNNMFFNRHVAVDELGPEYFDTVHMIGSGVIQKSLSELNSFHNLFTEAKIDASLGKCIGIVITKPPESVCVILPPKEVLSGGLYILFDSHARPQDGFEGSYLIIGDSERMLVNRLRQIFPSFGFGAAEEADNFYAQMYNTFEGTAFEINT